jgi:diaminohydroxyphosphoribosylaminopyrimidine deaminase/5-amino-6-(5-phosphoribosylamino)uracil reductase
MKYRNRDEFYMAAALHLAKRGVGKTSPNPPVGCVIVKNDTIIAGDYHHKAGKAHAEVLALGRAREKAADSTIYVTLEPCDIYGKTPPCTKALIDSGIKRVVVGAIDPNPKVNGRGIKRLRQAGIAVITGVLGGECKRLIRPYAKYITTGIPFVTVKYAQSMDGRIATKTGASRWISSPLSLRFAHQLRAQSDAILVGAGTANKDNPQLTVRLVKGKNPIRIVLAQSGKLKKDIFLLTDNSARTIVATGRDTNYPAQIERLKVPVKDKSLNLKTFLKLLGNEGIANLLIEGGAQTITNFLKQGLVDRIILVTAPLIIGEGISAIGDLKIKTIDGAIKLNNIEYKRIGADCVIMGDLN